MDKLFAVLKAIAYALAYFLGRRNQAEADDLEQLKTTVQEKQAALQEANKALKDQGEVYVKTREIKARTPDDWDVVERMQSNAGTGKPSA